MPRSLTSRRVVLFGALAGVIAAGAAVATAGAARLAPSPPFAWLVPAAPPAGWKPLVPSSKTSQLWYPPSMQPITGDPYAVAAARKDAAGRFLTYLDAGPSNGGEQVRGWPSFRIAHLRDEGDTSVNETGAASGLAFRGGNGSCVIDDYVTRVKNNHYREIACIAQGRTTTSVIVAAALASRWAQYAPQLERAIAAWQVR